MAGNQRVVVLLSGGMDSVCALYHAASVWTVAAAISFDYGARHNGRELPFAQHHCGRLGIRHEVVALDCIGALFQSALLRGGAPIPDGHYEEIGMRQTVVPFRNGIFLAIAAGFAESIGADGLVIAAHGGDHAVYPDCREPFMQAMQEALRLGTYAGIALLRPFIAMSKAEIARRGQALGVPLAETWSCYKGGERHCGSCGTCVERREAFLLAGLPDPTDYVALDPLPPKPGPGTGAGVAG